MRNGFSLEILHTDKNCGARYGILKTPHGECELPMFMPVGTQATVKMLSPEELISCNAKVVLANTYHLALRPGTEIIKSAGGIHKFMNYSGPMLTDSGGFQVFSLTKLRDPITEEGVSFKDPLSGKKYFFCCRQDPCRKSCPFLCPAFSAPATDRSSCFFPHRCVQEVQIPLLFSHEK